MASIIKVGAKWRVQIRRKGQSPQTKTFSTKVLAQAWAKTMEGDAEHMQAGIMPTGKAHTVGKLIERYELEIGKEKPFGRNKADVLKRLKDHLEDEQIASLTAERIVKYIREDRKISGVTASIDLTYLKGVFKVARALWRIPISVGVVDDAREILRYMGELHKSNERDRRPTLDELTRLKAWFAEHSEALTPDHLDFIIASCFRPPSEITRLRWDDLNETDRTTVIHDRKDPRKKIGNHQTVPLLGECMSIIKRQTRLTEGPGAEYIFPVNGKSWSSIFPRACKAVEPPIVDLKLYDLRHEAISRLVEADQHSIPQMMLITGHKDPKQLMRYTQLRAKDLHRDVKTSNSVATE